jgi:hypothetical protein
VFGLPKVAHRKMAIAKAVKEEAAPRARFPVQHRPPALLRLHLLRSARLPRPVARPGCRCCRAPRLAHPLAAPAAQGGGRTSEEKVASDQSRIEDRGSRMRGASAGSILYSLSSILAFARCENPADYILRSARDAVDASGIRKVFDLAARLKDPINLSIGQPDFDVPAPRRSAPRSRRSSAARISTRRPQGILPASASALPARRPVP